MGTAASVLQGTKNENTDAVKLREEMTELFFNEFNRLKSFEFSPDELKEEFEFTKLLIVEILVRL